MVIGYCGGGTYWLQRLADGSYCWSGLKDNAVEFHSKIMAEKIIEEISTYSKIKPIIVIV
jgi:hypothetical protein